MSPRPRLRSERLHALPAPVARPGYDRGELRGGIVQLGLGAFARAHLALATELAIEAGGDRRWGIVGATMRSPAVHDALAPQQGLYTLAERDAAPDGAVREALRVIGCVTRTLAASTDPVAVIERIAAAETRIVSLTITEKGYGTGAPGGAADLIVRGLARRRERGGDGLTLLSLDNLPANGERLRERVLARAHDDGCGGGDPALATWLDQRCRFPNSMVDRIVPRTTDDDVERITQALGGVHDAAPVLAEPFFDWAVEDRFVAERPDWQRPNVRFVAAAAPWEQIKLRLVNGAHSQIAYLAAMAGWSTVDAAVGQPLLAAHIESLLRDEAEPTLPPLAGWDREAYRAALLVRWRNPGLAHRCQQIAMDGSQKVPQRWIPMLQARLRAGAPIPRLALGVAAWIHYLRGCDEAGRRYPIDDPLADTLAATLRRAGADATAQSRALLALPAVFGPVAGDPRLVDAVATQLQRLRTHGVTGTLRQAASP